MSSHCWVFCVICVICVTTPIPAAFGDCLCSWPLAPFASWSCQGVPAAPLSQGSTSPHRANPVCGPVGPGGCPARKLGCANVALIGEGAGSSPFLRATLHAETLTRPRSHGHSKFPYRGFHRARRSQPARAASVVGGAAHYSLSPTKSARGLCVALARCSVVELRTMAHWAGARDAAAQVTWTGRKVWGAVSLPPAAALGAAGPRTNAAL